MSSVYSLGICPLAGVSAVVKGLVGLVGVQAFGAPTLLFLLREKLCLGDSLPLSSARMRNSDAGKRPLQLMLEQLVFELHGPVAMWIILLLL